MKIKWELLILTQPGREAYLARLQAVLRPQLEEYADVQMTVRQFNASQDLGANRQIMREESQAAYSNYLDDDDLVPSNYIATIYPLLDGVDYIGFRLQMYSDGEKQKPTFHSLRYKEWNADQDGYYRDISHLNPMRRELALLVPMSGGFGEDARWADQLRALGVVKTEHFIDDVMYFYYWRSNKNDYPGPAFQIPVTRAVHNPMEQANFVAGQRRPICPECGSSATGLAGGMRRCNQCAASWI
jgi:hypothetical protein